MPKWHETMRPILESLARTNSLMTAAQLRDAVAEAFSMTVEERAERLKSGQLRFSNRVFWGITDLEKAHLLEYGKPKGTYRITEEGKSFLSIHSGPISGRDLYEGCPSFKAWKDGYQAVEKPQTSAVEAAPRVEVDERESPQEAMESAYGEICDALADGLVSVIMGKSPDFFEHLVGKVLVAMGYGESLESSATVTQKSGDEGVDGVVREDRLGFGAIYYQAKRWDPSRTVGRPEIQAFVGALIGKGATKGLFITTAHFSAAARSYVEGLRSQKVVLIDGEALAKLMIEYNVGVSTREVYEVKTIDTDFFADE